MPAHGIDIQRRGGIIAEFAAQMTDMNIDKMFVPRPRRTPHWLRSVADG